MNSTAISSSTSITPQDFPTGFPGISTLNISDALKESSSLYFFNVADNAANIAAELDWLQGLAGQSKIGFINVTDTSLTALALSPDQLTADAAAIGRLSGNFYLSVAIPDGGGVNVVAPSGHASAAQYSQCESLYTLGVAAGGGVTVTCSGGVDNLVNVNELQFCYSSSASSVQNVFIATPPGSGDAPTSGNITELYGAAFGRAPDLGGLSFYQNYLAAHPGTPLQQFATWFLASPEYANNTAHNYDPTVTGNAQFITDSYQNLLSRTPSAGEVDFYQNVISSHIQGLTPGTSAYATATAQAHALVITYFSQSPEFLSDVQIQPGQSGDAHHWLFLA